MKKRVFKLLTIMLLMFPVSIFADSLKVTCSSTKLEPNKTASCTITGTTSTAVSGVSAKLNASGNVKISGIKANSIWQGDGEGGNFELYTDTNKTGTFNIGSFTITATGEGTGTINVSNITYSDANFEEKSVSNASLNITVAKKEVTPTPTPTPTPTTGDATLKSLTITPGTLKFSKNTTTYTVNVPTDTTSVSIKAAANDSTSKVTIPTNLNLTGDKTTFKVVVTAKDNTKKTYTINVVKKDDSEEKTTETGNANIKTMSIEGITDFKFDPNTTYYTVKTDASKLNISVVLEDMTSEYNVLGNSNIQNGDTVLIQVKAKDGTVKEYRLKIVKETVEPAKEESKTTTGSNIPTIVFVIAELLWLVLLALYIKLAVSM